MSFVDASEDNLDLLTGVSYSTKLSDETAADGVGKKLESTGNLDDIINWVKENPSYSTLSHNAVLSTVKDFYFKDYPDEFFTLNQAGSHTDSLSKLKAIIINHHKTQLDEVVRLRKILAPNYKCEYVQGFVDGCKVNRLDHDIKDQILIELDNLVTQVNPDDIYCRHRSYEKLLNKINGKIIINCLTDFFDNTRHGTHAIAEDQILDLNGALTRIPRKAIKIISKHIENYKFHYKFSLFLTNNQLKWLPEFLFDIPAINRLDVGNNLLTNLPESLVNWQESLTGLNIGNFEPLGDRCACCDHIQKRTTGNSFKILPESIYQLPKLKYLDLASIGLKKLDVNNLFDKLPELQSIGISHNELTTDLPLLRDDYRYKQRDIQIHNLGNYQPLFSTNKQVWEYRYVRYIQAPVVIFLINHPKATKFLSQSIESVIEQPAVLLAPLSILTYTGCYFMIKYVISDYYYNFVNSFNP